MISKAPCHLATCAQVKTAVLRVINVGSKEEDSKCLSKTLDRNGQNTKVSKGGGVCRVPFAVLDVSIGVL